MLWIKEEGWYRLTKRNLKLYLSNNEISLKPVVRQELYNEVNKKLKNATKLKNEKRLKEATKLYS